jgi:C4-dicarboxylate-specific signal transduction histidine kinase
VTAADTLRAVSLFSGLSDEDIDQLCAEADEVTTPTGELLFSEGDAGDAAYVVTAGDVEIFKTVNEREVLLATGGVGRVFGEMALLLDEPRNASVRATSQVTAIRITRERLDELLHSSPSAALAMLLQMLERFRDTQSKLRQSDRMVQLGTLTAGLAHELNNPVAAIERGTGQLQQLFAATSDAGAAAAVVAAEGGWSKELAALVAEVRAKGTSPEELGATETMDREAEIEDWLEDNGIEEAWELASPLVAAGMDSGRLGELAAGFGDSTELVLRLLASEYEVARLLYSVGEGAARTSAIVRALKSYAFLDQAPVQEVEVTKGIDDTLLILTSKILDITVTRSYAPDLPKIEAYGSELNQVWTNLIDNAAYAVHDGEVEDGKIEVRAFVDGTDVIVEVEDNGPGIPKDARDRVFDSFFTTKPVGEGTGLGLDISYGIVVDRHRGQITFDSEPGRTCFRVALPIER